MVDVSSVARLVIAIGLASQYAAGVMHKTIEYRQHMQTSHSLPLELPSVDGYIAAQDSSSIGSIVYLRPSGSDVWESFLVVDCASKVNGSPVNGESSYDWMKRNNILAEVDHDTAVRWNTVGRAIEIEMLTIDELEKFE